MNLSAPINNLFCDSLSADLLNCEVLEKIGVAITHLKPLFEDVRVSFSLLKYSEVKSMFKGKLLKAPHYILVKSEKKSFFMQNAGFYIGQLMLHLSSLGLSSCICEKVKFCEKCEENFDFCALVAIGKYSETYDDISYGFNEKRVKKAIINYREICDSELIYLVGFMGFKNIFEKCSFVRFFVGDKDISVFLKRPFIGDEIPGLKHLYCGICTALLYSYICTDGRKTSFYSKGTECDKNFIYFLSCNI